MHRELGEHVLQRHPFAAQLTQGPLFLAGHPVNGLPNVLVGFHFEHEEMPIRIAALDRAWRAMYSMGASNQT